MYLVMMEWINGGVGEKICNTDSLAVAKAVYRHYVIKEWYNPNAAIEVYEYDGDQLVSWPSIEWRNTFWLEQEKWFKRKGLDYGWWIQFDEIRNI